MENENEKILESIRALQTSIGSQLEAINSQFGTMNRKLSLLETEQEKISRKQAKQQENIDTLFREVRRLTKSEAVIWKRENGHKVAIDKGTAYSAFNEIGFTNRETLRILEDSNVLLRDKASKGRTKTVRIPMQNRTVKAIVILTGDEDGSDEY